MLIIICLRVLVAVFELGLSCARCCYLIGIAFHLDDARTIVGTFEDIGVDLTFNVAISIVDNINIIGLVSIAFDVHVSGSVVRDSHLLALNLAVNMSQAIIVDEHIFVGTIEGDFATTFAFNVVTATDSGIAHLDVGRIGQ